MELSALETSLLTVVAARLYARRDGHYVFPHRHGLTTTLAWLCAHILANSRYHVVYYAPTGWRRHEFYNYLRMILRDRWPELTPFVAMNSFKIQTAQACVYLRQCNAHLREVGAVDLALFDNVRREQREHVAVDASAIKMVFGTEPFPEVQGDVMSFIPLAPVDVLTHSVEQMTM